jgi:hypothetical protein
VNAVEDERVPITFHDRVVEAQITERSWRLVDSTGAEVAWSVLIVAPTLLPEGRPAIVECRQDVDDLLERNRVPPDVHAALTATLPEKPGGPVRGPEHAVRKRGMVARATEDLTQRYLALAESEPELKDDLVAWFKRAEEKRLFGSLALYDLRRQYGDPLPVATYNWNLEGRKTVGWKASACVQSGVSTLYENAIRAGAPGPNQGRRLVIHTPYATPISLSTLIATIGLQPPAVGAPPPPATPFVVRAATTGA